MKGPEKSRILLMVCMILGLVLVLGPGSSLQGEDKAVLTLTENDCVKCHKGPPADVMAAGKA
ncbi:MAG: hypothetical protein GY849_21510, partial [Deltaproteobacteria bacterium]|nr:hypothetical protein [Deltaproteobacteria bacterium]